LLGEGDRLPDVTLLDDGGATVTTTDLLGGPLVLYFYPKDDTPGCTKEACSFRDNLPRFGAVDAVVLGVSKDSLDSHTDFIKKYGLNFTLLSDEDLKVNNLYGTWVEKENYGKKYWGTERSTFVIGKDGKIKKVFRRVKVDGHEDEVLKALSS
jgi:peroxiredoxin Q/BCP